jgi:hypothetical protein
MGRGKRAGFVGLTSSPALPCARKSLPKRRIVEAASSADLNRLRAEIGSLNQRIDEARSGVASEHDVHALRVAVEQLSTRVAQGPDMRPLADMDRRLADVTSRLAETQAQAVTIPAKGTASTLDIASWNLEWFGDTGNGPTNAPPAYSQRISGLSGSKIETLVGSPRSKCALKRR